MCNLTYCFDYLDNNHKGYVSESDIFSFFKKYNVIICQKDTEKIVEKFDRNFDRLIDLDEFIY